MAVVSVCKCGKKYILPDTWADRTIDCRFCGAEIELGAPDPEVPVPGLPVPPSRQPLQDGLPPETAAEDVSVRETGNVNEEAEAGEPLLDDPLPFEEAPAAPAPAAAAPLPEPVSPPEPEALPDAEFRLEPLEASEDPTRETPAPASQEFAFDDSLDLAPEDDAPRR